MELFERFASKTEKSRDAMAFCMALDGSFVTVATIWLFESQWLDS